MEELLPRRRANRLPGFDYSRAGYYFLTICTANHRCLLCRGAQCAPDLRQLTEIGDCVERAILEIPVHYPKVSVDKYVVMPNHVHIVLALTEDVGRTMCAPTVSHVVKQLKETVTKRAGVPIWQKGFYDHVIRDGTDYLRIWEYMDNNPARWREDCYYGKSEDIL